MRADNSIICLVICVLFISFIYLICVNFALFSFFFFFLKAENCNGIKAFYCFSCSPVTILDIFLQLEVQCHALSSEKQESHVENVKLKMTNDELSRALEGTSQELSLAQEQLTMLQEQAARLQQEKEMWVDTLYTSIKDAVV